MPNRDRRPRTTTKVVERLALRLQGRPGVVRVTMGRGGKALTVAPSIRHGEGIDTIVGLRRVGRGEAVFDPQLGASFVELVLARGGALAQAEMSISELLTVARREAAHYSTGAHNAIAVPSNCSNAARADEGH